MGRGIARIYTKNCTCTDKNKKDNWTIMLADYPNNQTAKGIRFYCECGKCNARWYTRSKYVMELSNTHKFKEEIKEMLRSELYALAYNINANKNEIKRMEAETEKLRKKHKALNNKCENFLNRG